MPYSQSWSAAVVPSTRLLCRCTFPDNRDSPIRFQQFGPNPLVSFHVGPELLLPEVRPRCGIGGIAAAGMAVPEASRARNIRLENDGRPSPAFPESLPSWRRNLTPRAWRALLSTSSGFRVLAANPRHDTRSSFSIYYVDHSLSCLRTKRKIICLSWRALWFTSCASETWCLPSTENSHQGTGDRSR